MVQQDSGRRANRLFRIDGTVGFQIQNQLVQVGALFDARALDPITDPLNWAERSVQAQSTDGPRFAIGPFPLSRRPVTTTLLDLEPHAQLATLGQVGDDLFRVDDLNGMALLDIASRDWSRTFLGQCQARLTHPFLQGNRHALQVEENIDHILLHTLDGGVFVQHLLNLTLDNRGTWDG